MIKLRNPWGSKAWKGNWSANSDKWTPELRKKLNYKKDPNDGTFYMDISDFETCFDQPTICQITDGYVNSTITINSDRQHSVMVEFAVRSKGKFFLSMYQESKRKYKASGNYELSKSRLFLARKTKEGKI